MATNVLEGNGDPTQETGDNDIKILVVGDKNIGKSTFIEAFTKRFGNATDDYDSREYARVYKCRYEIQGSARDVEIFEILGGPDNFLNNLTKDHFDANGVIFMYAIDDPVSFERVQNVWYNTLIGNGCLKYQPYILVGNKKDLRENDRVIQRLARINQSPVTEEQGKSVAMDKGIEFYECVSTDENYGSIQDAFHHIVYEGFLDLTKDISIPPDDAQAENQPAEN